MTGPFELVKSEVLPLTPSLAQEFRDMPGSPTERDLDRTRLRHLRAKADHHQLVTFQWAKARFNGDGLWYRVNGNHSSHMLCELDGNFPTGLFVHVDEYSVEGPDGLAVLFRQFDDRKSGRSPADVAGAYQNLEEELRDLQKPIGKIGIEGVTFYRRFFLSVPTKVGDEQYNLFHESALHKYLIWLNEIFSIKTPELKRVPIVAAMHGTFEHNEEEARKFWQEVSRGGKDYDDNAPSTVLDKWLKASKVDKLHLAAGEYFRGCVYAWNAYRGGKTIKEIRYDSRKVTQTISD